MIYKLFIVLLICWLIHGVLNDYPAYEEIPDLTEKAKGIKEGIYDRLSEYKEKTMNTGTEDVIGNLKRWKEKIMSDVEEIWNQLSQHVESSKKTKDIDPHYDIIEKFHRILEKLLPDSLISKHQKMTTKGREKERIEVVEVAGCDKSEVSAVISEDKRYVVIQGKCTIYDGRGESDSSELLQKEINEEIKIPANTQYERITTKIKHGLLIIIFPTLEAVSPGKPIELEIDEL